MGQEINFRRQRGGKKRKVKKKKNHLKFEDNKINCIVGKSGCGRIHA